MTTDASKCKCDIPKGYRPAEFTEEYPFGVPDYDPFCGQPNLQANIFANYDRMMNLLGRTKIPDLPIFALGTYIRLLRVFFDAFHTLAYFRIRTLLPNKEGWGWVNRN